MGSPRQKLTLSELYESIECRFPYYKTAKGGWKNSVRHTLSLNKCFVSVARPPTEPGKGAYWTYAAGEGEGKVRYRKRNKKKGGASANADASTLAQDGDAMDVDNQNPSLSDANSTTGSDASPDSVASLEARGLGPLITMRADHQAKQKQVGGTSPQQDDRHSTSGPPDSATSENDANSQTTHSSPSSTSNSPLGAPESLPPLVLSNGRPVPHGPSGRARIPYCGPFPLGQDLGAACPPHYQRHVSSPFDEESLHTLAIASEAQNGRNGRRYRYTPY